MQSPYDIIEVHSSDPLENKEVPEEINILFRRLEQRTSPDWSDAVKQIISILSQTSIASNTSAVILEKLVRLKLSDQVLKAIKLALGQPISSELKKHMFNCALQLVILTQRCDWLSELTVEDLYYLNGTPDDVFESVLTLCPPRQVSVDQWMKLIDDNPRLLRYFQLDNRVVDNILAGKKPGLAKVLVKKAGPILADLLDRKGYWSVDRILGLKDVPDREWCCHIGRLVQRSTRWRLEPLSLLQLGYDMLVYGLLGQQPWGLEKIPISQMVKRLFYTNMNDDELEFKRIYLIYLLCRTFKYHPERGQADSDIVTLRALLGLDKLPDVVSAVWMEIPGILGLLVEQKHPQLESWDGRLQLEEITLATGLGVADPWKRVVLRGDESRKELYRYVGDNSEALIDMAKESFPFLRYISF